MKIPPIVKSSAAKNPPHQRRALMSIRYEEHTVIDTKTGTRTILPGIKAWELYDKINRGEVDIMA